MKSLEQQVRDYYGAQALPTERVQSIVQLSRDVKPSHKSAWAMGAATAIALIAAILFALNRPPQADLTQLVMAEIAKNHSKHLAPEVATDRYEELQAKLSRLDFSARPVAEFLLKDYELVGGRYCSVQSEFVAQLKLRENASGETCTLYVVPLTPVLRQVKADTRIVNGVRVQVWSEDGRLFGLAREARLNERDPNRRGKTPRRNRPAGRGGVHASAIAIRADQHGPARIDRRRRRTAVGATAAGIRCRNRFGKHPGGTGLDPRTNGLSESRRRI